jgi:hypothetical protein
VLFSRTSLTPPAYAVGVSSNVRPHQAARVRAATPSALRAPRVGFRSPSGQPSPQEQQRFVIPPRHCQARVCSCPLAPQDFRPSAQALRGGCGWLAFAVGSSGGQLAWQLNCLSQGIKKHALHHPGAHVLRRSRVALHGRHSRWVQASGRSRAAQAWFAASAHCFAISSTLGAGRNAGVPALLRCRPFGVAFWLGSVDNRHVFALRVRPNPSLNARPATAGAVRRAAGTVYIFCVPPYSTCLRGRR